MTEDGTNDRGADGRGTDDRGGRTTDEARPSVVNVAAYWRGDFTLHPAPAQDEDGPDEPSLRRLGRSGITVHGRDLAAVLDPAYRAFRS